MLMFTKQTLAWYKIGSAALAFTAVVVQYLHGAVSNPAFSATNFFSFFTIESNILAATVFAVTGVWYLHGKNTGKMVLLRGAATLYMVITGIVYSLLLSGLEESLQTPIPWVNFVLHYLFPLLAFADWFIDRPAHKVTFKESLWWLVFPVVYLVYSLVRGPIVGWYPYPFLNPANGGYGMVFVTAIGITICGLMLCALFAKLSASQKTLRKK